MESIDFTKAFFQIQLKWVKISIPQNFALLIAILGLILISSPIIFIKVRYLAIPMLMFGILLFSDSMNFLLRKRSYLGNLTTGNFTYLVSSVLGGYIIAIFWEIFNRGFITWVYNPIPLLERFNIINYSILGVPLYIWFGAAFGYIGFYSAYEFFKNLLNK